MLGKYFLCLCFIGLVTVSSANEYASYSPDKPFHELPCLSFGGICVNAGDCPEGKQATVRGLCPVQQKKGVECCHSVPLSETTCRGNGGECMPSSTRCPEKLTFSRATDCESDEKCCILV